MPWDPKTWPRFRKCASLRLVLWTMMTQRGPSNTCRTHWLYSPQQRTANYCNQLDTWSALRARPLVDAVFNIHNNDNKEKQKVVLHTVCGLEGWQQHCPKGVALLIEVRW